MCLFRKTFLLYPWAFRFHFLWFVHEQHGCVPLPMWSLLGTRFENTLLIIRVNGVVVTSSGPRIRNMVFYLQNSLPMGLGEVKNLKKRSKVLRVPLGTESVLAFLSLWQNSAFKQLKKSEWYVHSFRVYYSVCLVCAILAQRWMREPCTSVLTFAFSSQCTHDKTQWGYR